ncbi:condensation domain-containing protein, partial [Pseudomonas entomophila]|uniref:condensation domain-containing protein n=1 Tax=Pseudomonas entomophila TaxID=312306 RepID=UPI001F0085DE
SYQAPRSELECQLAQIWAEVLKLEKVGLADNFFELGGHSLLATQVISRVAQGLAIDVPLRTLFEHAILGGFAQAVGRVASKPVAAITRVARDQDLPLSFAQQRQWLLWQFAPDSTAYTIPAVLRLRGALDVAALERSFAALVERHESLRTTFRQTAEGPLQVIHDAASVTMPVLALHGATEAQVEAQIKQLLQRPFDLAAGPLLRVELL